MLVATPTRFSALLVFAAALASVPARARAAPPAATAADTAALTTERARLRHDLDRVNAEIDALKKSPRGVGDDYRLRARMADAESLARRLIDIEAKLGLRAPSSAPAPLPMAAPTDGPGDLDAKADILADQSRRVRLEADALDRRIGEIRGRQDLRRRAADLERDPFAPLEGSKRRVANIGTGDSGARTTSSQPPATPTGSSDRPPTGPTLGISNPGTSQTVSTPSTSPSPPPTPLAAPPPTALSLELRDLLDPATVAEIRRLEGTKTQGGSVQALERAVAALRARAASLDGQARTMRQSARAPR